MTRTPLHGRQCPTSPFRPAPALLGVGAFLLCACPTGAQTLSVGSGTATVSGTGTAVTGGGTTFGGGAGPGTSSYKTGTVSQASVLNLQDGGSFQGITVEQGFINVSGGTAGTIADVPGVDSSMDSINISGGTVTTVTNDEGIINITGGTVQSVGAASFAAGQITLSGGNVQNINTPSNLTVNGGTLGTASAAFVKVTGGTIQTLGISGSGAASAISGGNISTLNDAASGTTKISGGSFQFITDNGFHNVINITGTGLQEIGMPTDANNDGVFKLMGLLSDGETLSAQYTQSGTSNQLQFNGVVAVPTPVPEASTVVSLGGMLLLGGAGLAFRARKRAAA